MEAYALTHEPALVFNAARAYEEGQKKGDAAALFRLYLTISDDQAGVADARARLERLEERPAPQVAPPVDSQPAGKDPVKVVATGAAPDRTWAWVATGASVALVGGGVALLWAGSAASREANAKPVASAGDITRYGNDFDRAEALWKSGAAMTATGIAAAGFSVWLHARTGTTVAIGADGMGGVWLAGRW